MPEHLGDGTVRPWPDARPDEATGVVHSVEFVSENVDREPGTYVTIRVDDPEVRWSAGRVAVRYFGK